MPQKKFPVQAWIAIPFIVLSLITGFLGIFLCAVLFPIPLCLLDTAAKEMKKHPHL